MIEGLKPYAEYKESGQEWLGRVPTHWDVRRTKLILREVDSRSTTGKEQLLRVSQYTGVTQRKAADGSDAPDTRAASLVGYKRVSVNDLVINIMLAWNGSMGVSRFDGIASPAYCVYRLNKGAQPWYYHQLFRLPLYKGRIKAVSTGVIESRLRLYSDDLGRIEAILPPPDEQAAIVRYLDHANRKIDGFIRAKRKLIGLLNEQKQAIIHRAVTRGLHPDVPLKPSGVLWIDQIPAGWTMTPNRSLFRLRKVLVGARHKDYQVLSLTKRGVVVRDLDAGGKFFKEWGRAQEVRAGDLVFCFFDVDETPRTIGLSPALGMISPDYTVMECRDPLVASYLECFYLAMDDQKLLKPLYTGLRKRISKPLFLAAKTPLPPTDEMRSILAYIKESVVEIDKSLDTITREIALMQEYRTRLTADLVTGKLDVREAAAKLPEPPTEPAAEEVLEEIETEETE